jgi:DNA polymerase-3 subunit beta
MPEVLDDVDILSWLDKEESVKPVVPVKSAHTNTLTSKTSSGTNFEINREVLLALLDRAIGVVPSRDMIPVLTNFQFRVSEDELKVVASSLDMAIVISTNQLNVKVPGVEVFPARTFQALIKEINAGGSVYVEVTHSGAVVASGAFAAEIRLTAGADFPSMDAIDDIKFHEVNRTSFVDAISSVKYALPGKEYSGQDSLRMVSIKGGKFTACDGSRFQQVRIEDFKLNMQLPTFSITNLLKVLSSTDQETIEIGETRKRLVFRFNNTIFFINKLEDPYPNVEQLWLRPALSNDQEFSVSRQELITAIKQVKIAADTSSHAIGLMLTEDSVKIVAKDSNSNTAQATIPCKWVGKPKNIVVNYMHLAEMLKAYPQSECKFLLGEDTKTYKAPILLKDDDTLAIATISQMLAYRAGLTG